MRNTRQTWSSLTSSRECPPAGAFHWLYPDGGSLSSKAKICNLGLLIKGLGLTRSRCVIGTSTLFAALEVATGQVAGAAPERTFPLRATCSSWLNMVEVRFSILSRQALRNLSHQTARREGFNGTLDRTTEEGKTFRQLLGSIMGATMAS